MSFADQLFEQIATPLNDEFFGVPIIYVRGQVQSSPITAIGETTSYTLTDREGTVRVVPGRDYTLPVSGLVLNSVVVSPLKGDRILETINGVDHVYELLALADKPPAELLPGGSRWLLHTKRVS